MSKDYNVFDELYGLDFEAYKKQAEENEAGGARRDYLIHKVFSQNEDGAELYNLWRESLIMSPTAQEGMDMIGIGIREGTKSFIRKIGLTIKKVEET